VVVPGVGDGQRLQDATDGLAVGRLQDQVEVVVHQTVGEQAEGVALLGLGQGVQELLEVGGLEEDALTVVAAVEGVIDQAVGDQSWWSSLFPRLRRATVGSKRKMNCCSEK